jgi:hypothetical protein
MTPPSQSYYGFECVYCELLIGATDQVMLDVTGTFVAHFTCWYDSGPFEREVQEARERIRDLRERELALNAFARIGVLRP